jgi:nicotinamidase-related amidase
MALRARPAGRPRWRPRAPARDIVERLAPRAGDYFIIKPQFSGFYATNLQVLLPKLGVRRLILVGMAADICVLFTAADAHMRDYDLWIPADAVAGEDAKRTAWALEIMRASMDARIAPIQGGGLSDWREDAPDPPG